MSGLADEEIFEATWKRHARRAGMVVLLVACVAGLVFLVQGLSGEAKRPARQVTRITVVPDTPPPPPPPPPKEQPKPEPQKEVARQIDQPKPVEQPKPQEPQPLKMEGEAGDGPSPFAAGAVTKDYIGGDVGSGGGGLQFAFYSRLIQRHLQEALARRPEIKRLNYRVKVTVWLNADGAIRRAQLEDSTGNSDMDAMLRTALLDLPPLPESPPEKLPQPITVRITNRVTG